MSARTALPAAAVVAMLLAGCTSPDPEPAGLTAPPTASPTATATPEPSPTPTDGIQVHSDPATGIVFEDVPDLTGDEAEVYNWIAIHQNAYWETLRTNVVSDAFASIASSDVQATMAKLASDNAAVGVTAAGTFRVRISDIVISGDTATGVECNDLREATFVTADGRYSAEEMGQDIPKRYRMELLRLGDGKWYINRVLGDGTC